MFNQLINEIKKDPTMLPFLYKTSPQMFNIPEFLHELNQLNGSITCDTLDEATKFIDIITPAIHEFPDNPSFITKSIIKSWKLISESGNVQLIKQYHRIVGLKVMNIVQYARTHNKITELYS